jgi:hypothetical protein
MAIQRITKNSQSNDNSKDSEKSFILKVMEEEFGYTAAQCIISHITRTTMKSKAEILDRLSTFGLSKKI